MGVLCRMGRPDQVGLWQHVGHVYVGLWRPHMVFVTTYCCMGTHMVFSATSNVGLWRLAMQMSAFGGCCRPLAADHMPGGIAWATSRHCSGVTSLNGIPSAA